MSNIFVVTRNQIFFQRLEQALAGTGHQLTCLNNTYGLPDEGNKPKSEKTVHLVVLDVDFSSTWADITRRLTRDYGFKVVVASAHPTPQETMDALAQKRGGTALDYFPTDTSRGELAEIIQRALAYERP